MAYVVTAEKYKRSMELLKAKVWDPTCRGVEDALGFSASYAEILDVASRSADLVSRDPRFPKCGQFKKDSVRHAVYADDLSDSGDGVTEEFR